MLDEAEEDPAELRAARIGLSYVSLDGDIACLVNGAGLAMSTMDLIKYHGGEPANFLDVGGGANKDQVLEGFRILLSESRVKAVLVNIFGGIMKCDTIAAALLAAYDEMDFRVPLVVRLEGTNVEQGQGAPQGERPQDHHGRRPDRRGAEGRRGGEGRGLSRGRRDPSGNEADMETETMGRVLVAAKIENIGDLFMAEKGLLACRSGPAHRSQRCLGRYRSDEPLDAKELIERLGLFPIRTRTASDQRRVVQASMFMARFD